MGTAWLADTISKCLFACLSRWLAQPIRQLAAEQCQARGLLVASISHDLRAPLTRMRMRLETEHDETRLRTRSMADIREMDALIANVVEMCRVEARAQPEDAAPTDVGRVARAVVDEMVEQGCPVAFDGATAAVVRASPEGLKRIVTNLVSNAVRYGGGARVRVGIDPDGVVVAVEDDGPGIPPDELDRVMQPFYRARDGRHRGMGGTGLGLYIARELTQRQGGTLVLENRPQGGLRAVVSLPLR